MNRLLWLQFGFNRNTNFTNSHDAKGLIMARPFEGADHSPTSCCSSIWAGMFNFLTPLSHKANGFAADSLGNDYKMRFMITCMGDLDVFEPILANPHDESGL